MELQKFINDNEDYIFKFKENKMQVKKYTKIGLVLVKTYSNNEYDYENNPWMRYCRGSIINMENNRVVCVPPIKSVKRQDINLDDYDDTFVFEPLIDGTMINMFYHKEQWMLSTRSSIGAKNSWDEKIKFCELFENINGTEWYSNLNKEKSYSFVLQHRKNRIVSQIMDDNIFLVEVHDMKGDIRRLEQKEFDNLSDFGIGSNILMVKENAIHYFNPDLPYSIKGFTIKRGTSRIKWINPNYDYVCELKSKFNNKFLSYIKLRQEWKLSEYLKYFPEERNNYNLYRERYNIIKNKLYDAYINVNINKSIKLNEVDFPLRPLVYEIQGYYLKTKHKINMSYINDYMQGLPGKKVLFIHNRMFN